MEEETEVKGLTHVKKTQVPHQGNWLACCLWVAMSFQQDP